MAGPLAPPTPRRPSSTLGRRAFTLAIPARRKGLPTHPKTYVPSFSSLRIPFQSVGRRLIRTEFSVLGNATLGLLPQLATVHPSACRFSELT